MAGAIRFLTTLLLLTPTGCSTYSAKITGSSRAGAEELLLTGTADRAIACIDFRQLAGDLVYLDTSRVSSSDSGWIAFGLRREMARQGLLLVDEKKEARVVVEAAVAAHGTDEVDKRVSTPGFTSFGLFSVLPASSDPHVFARKSRQDAVVKLALVALDARSHRLIWESGTVLHSESLDREFFGTREVERRATLPELEGYPRRSNRE